MDPKVKQIGLQVLRAGDEFRGKQGHIFSPAISAERTGAKALHMQLITLPPGERSRAHKHEAHETAIYVISGTAGCFWGEKLEHHAITKAGDFCYIAADVPHLPYNLSASIPVKALIARTDPNEQESVVLMPKLEADLNWQQEMPEAESID